MLDQVLARFGDAATTQAVLAEVQVDGRVGCGPTVWRGEPAMRVSVSSWRTTLDDARRAADVIVECRDRVAAR